MDSYHEIVLSAMTDVGFPRHIERAISSNARNIEKALIYLLLYALAPFLGARHATELAERLGVGNDAILRKMGKSSEKRWRRAIQKQGRLLLQQFRQEISKKSAATQSRYSVTYALDDFTAKKRSLMWQLVAKCYSGAEKKIVPGLSIVTYVAVIGDGKLIIPLDIRIKRPPHQGPGRPPLTKNEVAIRILRDFVGWAQRAHLPTRLAFLPVDAWYVCGSLIGELRALGLVLIGPPKKDWRFFLDDGRDLTVKELLEGMLQFKESKRGRRLPFARFAAWHNTLGELDLIVFEDIEGGKKVRKCLVCSFRGMEGDRIIRAWKNRWAIETFHWSLRQTFHVTQCRFKIEARIHDHLALRVLSCGLAHYMRWENRRKWQNVPDMVRCLVNDWQHWLPRLIREILANKNTSPNPARNPLPTWSSL